MTSTWRWNLLARRLGPLVLLAASLAGATCLIDGQPGSGEIGYAAIDPLRVGPLFAGRVEAIYAAPGDLVEAGQLLLRMDSGTVEAERRVLVEEIEEARADLALASAADQEDLVARSLALSRARTRAHASRAELDAVRVEHERLAALHQRGLATREELSRLEVDLHRLRAEAAGRDRTLALMVRDSAPQDVRRARALAALQAMEARLAAVALRLDQGQLRAPVQGRVLAVHAGPGAVLGAGEAALTLVPPVTRTASLCLSEGEAQGSRPGDPWELLPRDGTPPAKARVVALGGVVEQPADRCATLGTVGRWGRSVVLRVERDLVPGQVFDARQRPSSSQSPPMSHRAEAL